MNNDFAIFVFSNNRGRYLENCILSIKNLTDNIPIHVIDDGSTDQYTLQILSNFSNSFSVSVIKPRKDEKIKNCYRTGGLNSNMALALDYSKEKGYKNVLFIQDDMQLTRKIFKKDLENLKKIFEMNGDKSFMIKTCFFKRKHKDRYRCQVDKSGVGYNVKKGVRIYFSDTGIFNIKNYFRLHPGMKNNEVENNAVCEQLGLKMPMYVYPFMHWVPYPEAHRGKKRIGNLS